jgi:AcrR family transcriptional regulator
MFTLCKQLKYDESMSIARLAAPGRAVTTSLRVKKSGEKAQQKRLSAVDRRATLLAGGHSLLTERGAEGLQINELAERVGVSRPIVYRFFPTRDALLVALLEDMEAELDRRMKEALLGVATGQLGDAVRAMVEACCDAIEAKGSGPWRMLDARGTDAELARVGRAIHARMLEPWHPLIRARTGLKTREASMLVAMLVAAGRAALDEWIDGRASRVRAVEAATRAVRALFAEFSA